MIHHLQQFREDWRAWQEHKPGNPIEPLASSHEINSILTWLKMAANNFLHVGRHASVLSQLARILTSLQTSQHKLLSSKHGTSKELVNNYSLLGTQCNLVGATSIDAIPHGFNRSVNQNHMHRGNWIFLNSSFPEQGWSGRKDMLLLAYLCARFWCSWTYSHVRLAR